MVELVSTYRQRALGWPFRTAALSKEHTSNEQEHRIYVLFDAESTLIVYKGAHRRRVIAQGGDKESVIRYSAIGPCICCGE